MSSAPARRGGGAPASGVRLRTDEGRDPSRPETRADCIDGPRPCPWVSCVHHLAIDPLTRNGARIREPFGDVELEELPATCSLDLAARGGLTLEQTAELVGLTRERVRQIEAGALGKLRELVEGREPRRRLRVL